MVMFFVGPSSSMYTSRSHTHGSDFLESDYSLIYHVQIPVVICIAA